jgi:hypothetical protein
MQENPEVLDTSQVIRPQWLSQRYAAARSLAILHLRQDTPQPAPDLRSDPRQALAARAAGSASSAC